ncbi:hypothetical protein NDU88_006984 [Pleurodeles waltl]|uniref:Uncharacterized protein n=1 Tax=Pleurodeles waltl TaxID=8319 RepID=A0AAV7N4N5_PLEWA|nr:hypothetical protein NDU88_006984 [Pleurodeles waltl]
MDQAQTTKDGKPTKGRQWRVVATYTFGYSRSSAALIDTRITAQVLSLKSDTYEGYATDDAQGSGLDHVIFLDATFVD